MVNVVVNHLYRIWIISDSEYSYCLLLNIYYDPYKARARHSNKMGLRHWCTYFLHLHTDHLAMYSGKYRESTTFKLSTSLMKQKWPVHIGQQPVRRDAASVRDSLLTLISKCLDFGSLQIGDRSVNIVHLRRPINFLSKIISCFIW